MKVASMVSITAGSVTGVGTARILDCRRGSGFALEHRNVERTFDPGKMVVNSHERFGVDDWAGSVTAVRHSAVDNS